MQVSMVGLKILELFSIGTNLKNGIVLFKIEKPRSVVIFRNGRLEYAFANFPIFGSLYGEDAFIQISMFNDAQVNIISLPFDFSIKSNINRDFVRLSEEVKDIEEKISQIESGIGGFNKIIELKMPINKPVTLHPAHLTLLYFSIKGFTIQQLLSEGLMPKPLLLQSIEFLAKENLIYMKEASEYQETAPIEKTLEQIRNVEQARQQEKQKSEDFGTIFEIDDIISQRTQKEQKPAQPVQRVQPVQQSKRVEETIVSPPKQVAQQKQQVPAKQPTVSQPSTVVQKQETKKEELSKESGTVFSPPPNSAEFKSKVTIVTPSISYKLDTSVDDKSIVIGKRLYDQMVAKIGKEFNSVYVVNAESPNYYAEANIIISEDLQFPAMTLGAMFNIKCKNGQEILLYPIVK